MDGSAAAFATRDVAAAFVVASVALDAVDAWDD